MDAEDPEPHGVDSPLILIESLKTNQHSKQFEHWFMDENTNTLVCGVCLVQDYFNDIKKEFTDFDRQCLDENFNISIDNIYEIYYFTNKKTKN